MGNAALLERSLYLAIMFFGREISDGLTEVPKELIAGLCVFNDAAGEDRDADRNRAAA